MRGLHIVCALQLRVLRAYLVLYVMLSVRHALRFVCVNDFFKYKNLECLFSSTKKMFFSLHRFCLSLEVEC